MVPFPEELYSQGNFIHTQSEVMLLDYFYLKQYLNALHFLIFFYIAVFVRDVLLVCSSTTPAKTFVLFFWSWGRIRLPVLSVTTRGQEK